MWPYTHSHTHIRLLTIHTQTLRPAKKYATDSLVGTWACNGAHKWRCYSSGEDVYRHLYPHVPKKYVPPSGKAMCGVTGSNQLYSFRALRSQTSMDFPIKMQAKFIRCKCIFCRNGQEQLCPSREEFGEWQDHELKLRDERKGKGKNPVVHV